jgi:outer membrane lipoprotein-sorting protein
MAGFLVLTMMCAGSVAEEPAPPPPVEQAVRKIQEVYADYCCFSATFDQLTVNVAMDMKDRFKGKIYVKKPGHIALDVSWPEKQKVVLQGRSYTVYFPEDRSAARGEVPPEVNVEHFFGFFANIGRLDQNFIVQYPDKARDEAERLIFLELTDKKNPSSTFRIVLGVDMDRYTIRRAIIYDALGNYNRFDLSDIAFLRSIPDSRFKVAPNPAEILTPSHTQRLEKRDKK